MPARAVLREVRAPWLPKGRAMPMMYRWQTAHRLNAFQVQPGYFESHGILIQLPPGLVLADIHEFRVIGDGQLLHGSTGQQCREFACIDGYALPDGFIGFLCRDTFHNLRRFSRLQMDAHRVDGRDVDDEPRESWHLWRVLV